MRRALPLALALCAFASAADWPTYRHDMARSGITQETLKPPLSRAWEFRPAHAPQPAWAEPNPRNVGGWYGHVEGRRVHFDDAYHVVVSQGLVCFGSSADGAVTALDAATGRVRWRTLTDGPVRLAPTFAGGKVYAASDDGHAYCLGGENGKTQWRVRVAPNGRKVLGSGKMVSLWPIRTSVLVDGDTAYVGAGIFPAEGVYLYALRASDGQTLWCNDSAGAAPQSRISPQGYLLASADTLFAPMGRVSPAAFARKDGRLLHTAYIRHEVGGSYALLADDRVYTGTKQMVAYSQKSPSKRYAWFEGRQLVVCKDTVYCATGKAIKAYDRVAYPAAGLRKQKLIDQRRGAAGNVRNQKRSLAKAKAALNAATKAAAASIDDTKLQAAAATATNAHAAAEKNVAKAQDALVDVNAKFKENDDAIDAATHWQFASDCADALILAGTVLYAGGAGQVVALDVETGKQLWSMKVDGTARGLAVAEGKLFVSTNTGAILCFAPEGAKDAGVVRRSGTPLQVDPRIAAMANEILKTSGVTQGYALVLGCGTGRLAAELAERMDMIVCGIEKDAAKVATARAALDKAGLAGARVHVERGDLSNVPFADYFANLVVCEDVQGDGDVVRMVKPHGGVLLVKDAALLRKWLAAADIEKPVITQAGDWAVWKRGPLPGAGSWTHQYAEPGNTTCSDDQLVKAPLSVLWFGMPGPTDMVERHHRAAAPLAAKGRLFVQGLGVLKAYDSYNGLKLWERVIPTAFRKTVSHEASNLVTDGDNLFVAAGAECYRIDAATGKTTHTYALPAAEDAAPRTWGYVARVGDLLYGTRSPGRRVADCIFALDAATGAVRWKTEPSTIPQASLSIGGGILYYARADVTDAQREQAMADVAKSDPDAVHDPAAVRLLVAVDAATGKAVWERPIALTGSVGGSYWCSLGTIVSRDVLLLFGVYADGHYWRQFFAGKFKQRRIVALSAKTGKPIWAKRIGYRVRPLVVGDTLHAEPWAFDLYTGEQQQRTHPITGKQEPWQFARPGHH
ncbi:PQQ-binding-like beta-propeller repeat protein, partial [bacterium]|nr:PQQ-binding-like beta-propeller repeat protein [bacterium]